MREKVIWLIEKDVALLEGCVCVARDWVTGNEMRVQQINYMHKCGSILKKISFTRHKYWNIMKRTPKYKVLPNGPHVVLNKTPLHKSTTNESPSEAPLVKAAKKGAARWSLK
ncbi:hypothetical protein DVH24_021151 [Malus domestica]|uniref:Uncharacterized protein n=1 Tax=Malus domestica TaxID=3750 RepID=A0A498J8W7_MALDO|nr:hypothetical protein DVH24_021151 [Malus domestica]